MREDRTISRAVHDACAPYKDDIRLAYLHGSRALGKTDKESDMDIGILLASSIRPERRFRLRIELARALAKRMCLPLEKVDLVILQDVPVLLRYNIIRRGVPVHQKSRRERIAYELATEQAYDDERTYLDRESAFTLQRILRMS